MRLEPLPLSGALRILPDPIRDERGWFARVFDADIFAAGGLVHRFVQSSLSHTVRVGTLRGLHFQRRPHGETKLVRVQTGAIFDVIVDLRPGSSTYLGWTSLVMSGSDGIALYIPEGFAHGFQTLEPSTTVHYDMDSPYVPEAADGIAWDDPDLGIDWPFIADRIIPDRDRRWPPISARRHPLLAPTAA